MAYAFHEFDSDYRISKRLGRIPRDQTTDEFYDKYIQAAKDWKGQTFYKETLQTRAEAQKAWYRCGQPYLKVWPGMAAHLAKVNIDIPIEELVLPFPAFEVRLSTTDNVFQETANAPPLRTIFLWKDNDRIRLGLDFGFRAEELPITIWFEQVIPYAENELTPPLKGRGFQANHLLFYEETYSRALGYPRSTYG